MVISNIVIKLLGLTETILSMDIFIKVYSILQNDDTIFIRVISKVYFEKEVYDILNFEEVFELGEQYYINGEYEKAISYVEECIKMNESNDCLNYIGYCYFRKN
jgi:tetratricopeptide (TPR) repeat protein